MKGIKLACVFFTILILAFTHSFAQTEQEQRIKASFILAFGTTATQQEVDYWKTRSNLSISQLIEFHRQGFASYPNLHKQTIAHSYADALGRSPTIIEVENQMKNNLTYTELMKNHMTLLQQPGNTEYVESIKRSYTEVLNRQPSQAEIDSWKGQGIIANYLLKAYHNDYKNQTTKGNKVKVYGSPYAIGVSVSAAIAREATGIILGNASALAGNNVGAILAAGAGNLVNQDGASIVAAGAVSNFSR